MCIYFLSELRSYIKKKKKKNVWQLKFECLFLVTKQRILGKNIYERQKSGATRTHLTLTWAICSLIGSLEIHEKIKNSCIFISQPRTGHRPHLNYTYICIFSIFCITFHLLLLLLKLSPVSLIPFISCQFHLNTHSYLRWQAAQNLRKLFLFSASPLGGVLQTALLAGIDIRA